ncbi:MAG: lipid-A-disaccharide synthase [Desulfamplus sp.]|nr:lipid-A-disaccharide synthase [Desulfamplus sp.]
MTIRKILQKSDGSKTMTAEQNHIMIIAGEPSGDLHGANLIKALRYKNPDLIITGIGGDLMLKEGMKPFFHIKDLSVMGITEVIMQLRKIKQAFDLFSHKIASGRPDLLILIDYPGFNLKAAARAKQISVPVLYYITPKVWAWKKSRLKKIKYYVDHAALIFPFEEAIFRKEKIPATFVGHPLVDHYHQGFNYFHEKSEVLCEKSESQRGVSTVIGMLPGSRESEISNLLPVMLESGRLINQRLNDNKQSCPDGNPVVSDHEQQICFHDNEKQTCSHGKHKNSSVRFVVSAASTINLQKFNNILKQYNHDDIFEVIHGEPTDIFRRCDLLIAASGTVTLEAAIFGVPMVIIYKTSALTYFLAKMFVKIPYVGLPNIIAGYSIVPELLQNDAVPEKIANKVLSIISPETLAHIRKQLLMIPRYLGGTGAAKRTAQIAMQMIER